jgi:hypothetical protein
MTQDEVSSLMKGIAPVLRKYIDTEILAAIKRLEQHDRGLKYLGVWRDSVVYQRNDVVTDHGGAFIAVQEPRQGERPGTGGAWTLMSKSDDARLRKLIREELRHAGQGSTP